MPPLETITSFRELLAEFEMEILADDEHDCAYRKMVAHIMKIGIGEVTTTFMTRTSIALE